ncbi:hypothetical protein, partial [Campylobacter sp.]
METQKIEELRKKMFKAPNKDEINEIVEKDLLEPPLAEIYKRLSKAKDEKELDKLIFEGIQNGSIKKEDWYSTPKNEQDLYNKAKKFFYLVEANIEFTHTKKILEKI